MDLSSRYGRYASMLQKWGWEPGKGLGKNEDGMTEFVKLSKKKDNAGLGTDPKKDPWDNWWEKVYNTALQKAKNTDNQAVPDHVDKKHKKKKEEPENNVSVGKLKFISKGSTNFADPVQSSVANLNYSESDSESESEEETKSFKPLTGDELFKICDGRVFSQMNSSFNPTGKLRRLQQQEKSFKKKSSNSEQSVETSEQSIDSDQIHTKKRKKTADNEGQSEEQEKKKKKKSKKSRK